MTLQDQHQEHIVEQDSDLYYEQVSTWSGEVGLPYFAERTLPKKTSCTSEGFISGTLAIAAAFVSGHTRAQTSIGIHLIACAPSCGAVREDREPKNMPTGVRAAPTM